MATTKEIIDSCLKATGESNVLAPYTITRTDCLLYINQLYQNEIGELVKSLATYSYDGSDAAHTITAGVGTLPSDYLMMADIYDGDPAEVDPLKQIFRIRDKVPDTDPTSQYMIPEPAVKTFWIFGTTPTNTIALYYYQKPTALTDSDLSSPTFLKEKFHLNGVFESLIKEIYAMRNNDTYDAIDMKTLQIGFLQEIKRAHEGERGDDEYVEPKMKWS